MVALRFVLLFYERLINIQNLYLNKVLTSTTLQNTCTVLKPIVTNISAFFQSEMWFGYEDYDRYLNIFSIVVRPHFTPFEYNAIKSETVVKNRRSG